MKLSLYYPVYPHYVNQPFGAVYNLGYYLENGINMKGHNGIDLAAIHGQPVFASHDGTAYYEYDDKQGDGVVVCSDVPFDYKDGQAYMKTIYWHFMPDYQIPFGTKVKAGDFLGWADSTGLSTGDHLHWALKPIASPSAFETVNLEQNNGYFGAIDQTPYCNGLFAQDLPIVHSFDKNIVQGEESAEVVYLQRALKQLGFYDHSITGFYGPITRAAVYEFQKKYVAKDAFSTAEVFIVRGNAVRNLTRTALNSLVK